MCRAKARYIIYYKDSDMEPDGYEVEGSEDLARELKHLHRIGAEDIEVYKEGPNFHNDKDDVILTNYK